MPDLQLVLYSGGQNRSNQWLHRAVVSLARRNRPQGPLKLTYLPFCAENAETFFMRSVRRYARFGVEEFCCLKADQTPSRAQIRAALDTDIVYLAGGNTFYFLKHLREAGLLPLLRRYAENGGVIAGLSAGAHILTPHIQLAGAPDLDPDPNEVRLRDLKSLGLVPFEFLPHFEADSESIRALRDYSLQAPHPIYACADGGGLVVRGKEITGLGKISVFYRGMVLDLRK